MGLGASVLQGCECRPAHAVFGLAPVNRYYHGVTAGEGKNRCGEVTEAAEAFIGQVVKASTVPLRSSSSVALLRSPGTSG